MFPEFVEDEEGGGRPVGERLLLDLDGYEGPLDLLLNLAREQKVDIAKISILRLADQYLAFVARVSRTHLDLAAEYLVMAAWLAYLKSRLLLPEPEVEEDEPSAAELADVLAFRLRRLEAMQRAGAAIMALPRLGQQFFGRGAPEAVPESTVSVYEVSLYDLLKAYSDHVVRTSVRTLHVEVADLWSVDDALRRLERMLGHMPEWSVLSTYLPAFEGDTLKMKSASAATFVAALELVRQGRLHLRQDGVFAPIYVKSTGSSHE
jgi:segregation and condensation protein A